MKISRADKTFKVSLALSIVFHLGGGGVALWMEPLQNPLPKVKPIQIKTIVYMDTPKPKIEKAHPIIPIKKTFKEIVKSNPLSARPFKGIMQIQPASMSVTSVAARNFSSTNHNPRSAKSIPIQTIKPTLISTASVTKRNDSLTNRKPKSAKPVSTQTTKPTLISMGSVAKRSVSLTNNNPRSAKPVSIQTTRTAFSQTGNSTEKAQQSHRSTQPLHLAESIVPSEKSLHGKASMSFSTATVFNLKNESRPIPDASGSLTIYNEATLEVNNKIKTPSLNHIQPVQAGFISTNFAEKSHGGKLTSGLKTFNASGQPKGDINSFGEDLGSLRKGFSSKIWGRIAKAKYYPNIARKRGWEGEPVIEFRVGKNGNLLGYSIAVASPYEILNQAALDAVKIASPFPKIPESLQLKSIKFKLPISFALNEP